VQLRHYRGTFTYRAADALHRARTDITEQRFHFATRDSVDEGRGSGQWADLGRALVDTVSDQQELMAKTIVAHDPDRTCQHEDIPGADLPVSKRRTPSR
jgi:hypothetical protein